MSHRDPPEETLHCLWPRLKCLMSSVSMGLLTHPMKLPCFPREGSTGWPPSWSSAVTCLLGLGSLTDEFSIPPPPSPFSLPLHPHPPLFLLLLLFSYPLVLILLLLPLFFLLSLFLPSTSIPLKLLCANPELTLPYTAGDSTEKHPWIIFTFCLDV